MYKNILVTVAIGDDHDSNASFQVAQVLADENAAITLLHVIEQIPVHALSYLPPDHMAKRRTEIEAKLAEMAKDLPGAVGAVGAVVSGQAGRAILTYAEENEIDCIIIASNRPGMQHLLLGSTAARVVRHAKCSVHVVR